MEISSLLDKKTIHLPLDTKSKEETIDKMAASMVEAGFVIDKASYVKAVQNREKTGSTGVGFGVAIPHGKSSGVLKAGLAFARLSQPVEWDSIDGKPVTTVFMIAVPEENVGNEHLKILIAISRKLIHEEFREQLNNAKSPDEIMEIVQSI